MLKCCCLRVRVIFLIWWLISDGFVLSVWWLLLEVNCRCCIWKFSLILIWELVKFLCNWKVIVECLWLMILVVNVWGWMSCLIGGLFFWRWDMIFLIFWVVRRFRCCLISWLFFWLILSWRIWLMMCFYDGFFIRLRLRIWVKLSFDNCLLLCVRR